MKTLKEKFTDVIILLFSYEMKINESILIAEEFAIGFGDFCKNLTSTYKHIHRKYPDATTKELLEIYKKEKGL